MNVLSARTMFPLALASLAVASGCGPSQDASVPQPSTGPVAASVETRFGEQPPPDLSVPPVAWENPGGMWMPEQVSGQADTLKKLGFTIDPKAFDHPTEAPLGAVVSLGGCSASFVSPDGLIITNHHCVIGALQYNSTPSANLLHDGFAAKTRADEKGNGPASRVFVTTKFTDVTEKVRAGLDKLPDDLKRFQALEDRQKALVTDCEKGRDGVRCSVASYFGGQTFSLVEQLEIRDVRLVFAPPEGVGNYGGETDNWRWPRHAGDFGFFRAYVGKDGKPADFAKDNVPYKPAHFLKIAQTPLLPGDPVLVAGYPAHTDRLTTSAETKDAVDHDLPYIVDFTQAYLDELDKLKKKDATLAIKAETTIRGLANWQTNVKGQIEGLGKGGIEAQKDAREADLKKFIDSDPARKTKFGPALDKMNKLEADRAKFRESDAQLRELTRMVRLFGTALTIVRNAEEREKPDDKRDPDFQERNQKRLEASFAQLSKSYDPAIDTAMLALVVKRELALPQAKRPGIAAALLAQSPDPKAPKPAAAEEKNAVDPRYGQAIAALYAKTKLGDEKARVDLLKTAKLADLKKSDDAFIKLALALRPKTKDSEDRDKKLNGAMANLKPLYAEATKALLGGKLAPDANRTLRVTFGTVRGYSPKQGAPVFYPFTKMSELVAKNQGSGEFDAPKALLEAVKAKRFGAYVDKKLGEVPIDFLSDLDITGGNSGSATLNGKGELVGLAFDGNYESMASDWIFIPEVTRSIHVDIRYVLWFIDAVAKDDALLSELGQKPTAR